MPSQRVHFTKRTVAAIKPPAEGNAYYRDVDTRGLELIVTANGHKAYYVTRKINGRSTRTKIGPHPEVSVEQAKRQAAIINGKIAAGKNPHAERQHMKAEATFGALFDAYLEQHAKKRKKTWDEDERMFKHHLGGWKNRQLREIRKQDVAALHSKVGKSAPYAANRLVSLVRKIFNFAVGSLDWTGANPCTGITKFPEKRRARILDAAELKRFFAALIDEPNEAYKDFFTVALLTGARRANVGGMKWADVDIKRGVWTIPGETSKSGEPMRIVLTGAVLGILERRRKGSESDHVFPSRYGGIAHLTETKKAWGRITAAAKLDGVRVHDLRRTMASWQVMLGTSPSVARDSLGQKTLNAFASYDWTNLDTVRASVEGAGKAMLKHGGKKLLEVSK